MPSLRCIDPNTDTFIPEIVCETSFLVYKN